MTSKSISQSKRIVKNTLLLYVRMLFTMVVSLYTSRVILNTLGVEDYGIYNVVGGVVTMFSILSSSLSSAISRFITYELGAGNKDNLNKIFSSAVTCQLFLALIILLLAEIIGTWFLNVKMNIPIERVTAANWVFQFSILTFVINLISVPYNASIIAHEKMSAFAYISILEVIGKLAIAFLIIISPIDKLVFYAILMSAVALMIRLAYGYYCKRHFEECTYHFIFDKDLLKRMFSFAGWNFIGTSSTVLRDQGGNILINLFCGPIVNAARGIAFQVNGAVLGFVANFMTALNPQITKSYAIGDHSYIMTLIFQGARLSFYMLLILSLPVFINTHYLLVLWLKIVPDYTVSFVQLILIFALSESLSNPLVTAMFATGNIRNYQLVVGGLQMLNLPISYILLHQGLYPEVIFFVAIVISQLCLAARLLMLRKMIGISVRKYMQNVYLNTMKVMLLSAIIPVLVSRCVNESFQNFIFLCIIAIISTGMVIYFVGCNKNERKFVLRKIQAIKE